MSTIRRSPKLALCVRRAPAQEQVVQRFLYPEKVEGRPEKRSECRGGCRPCPYVSCYWNNYLTVTTNGTIRFPWGPLEPWEVPAEKSCLLDLIEANPSGMTLASIGEFIQCTRERVRQVEEIAFDNIKSNKSEHDFDFEFQRPNESDEYAHQPNFRPYG